MKRDGHSLLRVITDRKKSCFCPENTCSSSNKTIRRQERWEAPLYTFICLTVQISLYKVNDSVGETNIREQNIRYRRCGDKDWVFPNETPESAFCFLGVLLDNTRKPCMQSGIMTLSEQLGQSSAENNNEMLQSSV